MKVRTIKVKHVNSILLNSRKNTRIILHKVLLNVRNQYEQGELWGGICEGVDIKLYQLGESLGGVFNSKIKKTLYELFKVWPEFSGNECFPVPSYSTSLNENEAYWILERWYEGEYAAARVRLLNFLIEETK